MRTLFVLSVVLSLLLAGCVVRHRHHRAGPPPGEPEPAAQAGEPEPPPGEPEPPPSEPAGEPEAPPPRTHRAPPAPAQPAVTVRLDKTTARRGEEVEIYVEPFPPAAMVFINGRPLPKRTKGNHFVITVPGNAKSGNVEIEVDGRRYGTALNVVD